MRVQDLLKSLFFTLLVSLGAQVEVPLGPVPFILSDFFVLMAGLVLGMHWGGFSVMLYLALGGLGLPIFAGGAGGYLHLTGPTGGYLLGFLLAAIISGKISHNGVRAFPKDLLATFSGQVCIFILGVSWLKLSAEIPWEIALREGFLPFIFPIALKLFSVSGLAWVLRKIRFSEKTQSEYQGD